MGVRALLLLARLLFLGLASPDDAPPDERTFVFLGHADKPVVDERLLLDAVSIYTRDLGITLVQAPGRQPAQLGPAVLDELAALLRARGARLGFWCQPGPGGHQIELVTVDPRKVVGRYPFDPDSPAKSDLYRSIALRLRSILAPVPDGGETTAAPAGPAPRPAVAGAPPPQPAVRAERPADTAPMGPLPPARNGPAEDGFRSSTPPGSRSSSDSLGGRMFIGAGYALSYPLGTSGGASARNALALDLMVAARPHIEWGFGTDLSPAGSRTSGVATISVIDIPLRVGGRWWHQIGPLSLGEGAFAGVRWLSANASAGAASERRTTVAGAAGVDVMARGPVMGGFAPQLRAWIEANVPRTRFTIQDVPAYDAGRVRLGLSLEVAAPAR